jgi:hypothetical protein
MGERSASIIQTCVTTLYDSIPEFTTMLAEKGYTCIESDFGPPSEGEMPSSSQSLMDRLSQGMLSLFIQGVLFHLGGFKN